MPLDREFIQHLQGLMTEVFTGSGESDAKYQSELLWKARQTHNAAAIPIAYKDAAIHALRTRFEQTVDRYLQALTMRGGLIDDASERQMIEEIGKLGAGPTSLHFPPGVLHTASIGAVQGEYVRERARVVNQLTRNAANRLKELKMKSKQVVPVTITNHFNAPVNTAYINSVHNDGGITISLQSIQDIEALSAGHPELEAAAHEIRTAYPQKTSMLEKAKGWVTLLGTVEGLTEKAIQHGPDIAALIHHFAKH